MSKLSFLSLFLVAISQAHAGGFKVLFTSFDPFGGSPANNTQAIVADLAANPGALGSDVAVATCNLPVVYDTASAEAMKCVNAEHPDAVISLGEADCELRLETAATNLDDSPGFPDNAGQERANSPIVPNGPNRSGFNFPVQALFCALDPSSPPVVVSTSPGAFVCNNTAYHLSQELGAMKIPFTFIHVPNSQCSSDQMNPAVNAAAIAKMVRAAIADLRASDPAGSPWPHPGNANLLPTDGDEAQELLSRLKSGQTPSCESEFARQMSGAYGSSNWLMRLLRHL